MARVVLIATILFWSLGAYGQERLVMIGGGARPQSVMKRFVELAGGEKARILVITWASGEPEESFAALERDLLRVGASSVYSAPNAPLNSQAKFKFLEQLEQATGVFFSGGDQRKIMEVLADEVLYRRLHAAYRAGKIFGGTSAGTAIMSEQMITGDGKFDVIDAKSVGIARGLGVLPGTIVDQHFIKRMRQNRLFGLILKYSEKLGIGIDEATALVVYDNRVCEVVGESQVMIVDGAAKRGALLIYLVKAGESFDLKRRRLKR